MLQAVIGHFEAYLETYRNNSGFLL